MQETHERVRKKDFGSGIVHGGLNYPQFNSSLTAVVSRKRRGRLQFPPLRVDQNPSTTKERVCNSSFPLCGGERFQNCLSSDFIHCMHHSGRDRSRADSLLFDIVITLSAALTDLTLLSLAHVFCLVY